MTPVTEHQLEKYAVTGVTGSQVADLDFNTFLKKYTPLKTVSRVVEERGVTGVTPVTAAETVPCAAAHAADDGGLITLRKSNTLTTWIVL